MITGASGGIGLAIAIQLAGQGYSLTLVARNENQLKKIVADLPGKDHRYLAADLSNASDLARVSTFLSLHHHEVLINNAGAGFYGKFTDIPLEDHLKMMHLNCDAMIALSYAHLGSAVKGDALINVGSTIGSTSYSATSAYAGSKDFVVRFTESLWDEYRQKGIFVSVFSPGVTSTKFHDDAGGNETKYPKAIQQTAEQVANELIMALHARSRPHVVSGFVNRSMLTFFRLLSRKSIVKMMGSFNIYK